MQTQIAIDGPAASGKSTVAKLLAELLGAYYINTGEMYRTLAWACLKHGIDPKEAPESLTALLPGWSLTLSPVSRNQVEIIFNGSVVPTAELRTPQVAAIVSFVAKIPAVRSWMLDTQRNCRSLGTIIMEGRDIATVVLPDATAKFFVTATPRTRARRRLLQPGEVPEGATLESVEKEIALRDEIDSTREIAPLKPAEDSVIVYSDNLTPRQVADIIIYVYKSKLNECGSPAI